ncbi:MAG: bifunctional UDP-N-acetylglucosamine diphosphorylase/glucosamine-1-phosphate N-acetyltransferase GlmU, partial [Synechococcaceae cyanobacterium]|nr:bifunctional UDP-N-acetylglucosamine diphosphorylase/glucosamine-1-phosphate N-acetyltransferase GlmU [Synechococcaceae cyanobacterium]
AVLGRIKNDNAQGEYYRTDAVELLRGDGKKAIAVAAATPEEILGVNDRAQLREIEEILAGRAGS